MNEAIREPKTGNAVQMQGRKHGRRAGANEYEPGAMDEADPCGNAHFGIMRVRIPCASKGAWKSSMPHKMRDRDISVMHRGKCDKKLSAGTK